MPDCYSVYDWSRSYLLPDHVVTNIPLRGSDGEPGAYNNARGLLVEVCLATGARPVALHYTETISPPDGGLTRITAVAGLPERARPLLVFTCCRYPLRGQGPEAWSICLDHAHLATEDRRFPPSPPWQAGIIARRLRPLPTSHLSVARPRRCGPGR
ncbi:MAG: hypothetical protein ACRDQG_09165 [Pseudonocardiaceae bacterium]